MLQLTWMAILILITLNVETSNQWNSFNLNDSNALHVIRSVPIRHLDELKGIFGVNQIDTCNGIRKYSASILFYSFGKSIKSNSFTPPELKPKIFLKQICFSFGIMAFLCRGFVNEIQDKKLYLMKIEVVYFNMQTKSLEKDREMSLEI